MSIHKKGYILVLTLLLTSALIFIVTQVFYLSTSTYFLSTTLIRREKAKVLALSGVQLAISRLTVKEEKKEGTTENNQPSKAPDQAQQKPNAQNDRTKKLMEQLLPQLNRWQTFTFDEATYDFEGEIKFCICCEDGKVNINQLYDFKKHDFKKPEYKKLLAYLLDAAEKMGADKGLLSQFEALLKERKFALNDVTELLAAKNGDYFKTHVFYNPDLVGEKKNVFLTDIFTTFSVSEKLQPLLLSNSLNSLLTLATVQANDSARRQELVQQLIKNYKSTLDIQKDWNTLIKPLVAKDLNVLPKEMIPMFNAQVAPKVFSVISSGTVMGVTQKVYAILQFTENQDKVIVSLKKLYWM